MPKYFAEKIFGHWLYFTTHCILEAMHVHASQDSKLREKGSAKFFVYADGTSKMMVQGTLRNHEVPLVQDFIKQHYLEMFAKWQELSDKGFYGEFRAWKWYNIRCFMGEKTQENLQMGYSAAYPTRAERCHF